MSSPYKYFALDQDGAYFVEHRMTSEPIGLVFKDLNGWSFRGAIDVPKRYETREDAATAAARQRRVGA
jgi:hypothetical protein